MAVKVLILEDNPVARSFLCRVVRESFSDSILITEAGDLESARRHVGMLTDDQPPPDPFKLVLVDLELPDGNGMELLQLLAPSPATASGIAGNERRAESSAPRSRWPVRSR